MLLTIDIGNTNITLGIYRRNRLLCTGRLVTDRCRSAEGYAKELKVLLMDLAISPEALDGGIYSTVAPAAGEAFARAVKMVCGFSPLRLRRDMDLGIEIQYEDGCLGLDRIADAVAARSRYPLPCVIIDMGTATTISVLDRTGAFIGGTIMAGLGTSLKALLDGAPQLPPIPPWAAVKVMGGNTADCMKSGLVLGTATMLDGMIEKIREELGERPAVVATGGFARETIAYCRQEVLLDEHLLLEGLRLLYNRNQGVSSARRPV